MANDPKAPIEGPQSGPKSTRRPYVKPSFRHEQVFETMALACGKVQPTGVCAGQKKVS
ncbi:MAG TPA: hypothetical protein VHP55_01605 [Usitatibacter sp.]|jgi:hypothetical protein|nr:hypothetical protein [Usitatibacter sp.]